MDLDKNRDVYLNFGLIAYGPLREIEKLQQIITHECKKLRIVYQTVTAKKLFLVKKPPFESPSAKSKPLGVKLKFGKGKTGRIQG